MSAVSEDQALEVAQVVPVVVAPAVVLGRRPVAVLSVSAVLVVPLAVGALLVVLARGLQVVGARPNTQPFQLRFLRPFHGVRLG